MQINLLHHFRRIPDLTYNYRVPGTGTELIYLPMNPSFLMGELRAMGMNILIVDDSSVMRTMILKTLRMSGLSLGDVNQASNGVEGLEILSQQWIDLVILDINMPVMNGEDMMIRMREYPETRDIPVIVVSTEGSKTRIENLVKMGATFIRKPFSPEIIRDAINQKLNTGESYG